MITVDPSGDLVVKVVELTNSINIPLGGERMIFREEEYLKESRPFVSTRGPLAVYLNYNYAQTMQQRSLQLKKTPRTVWRFCSG